MRASYTPVEPRAGFEGTHRRFALRDDGYVDALDGALARLTFVEAGVYPHLHVAAQGVGDGAALLRLLDGALEALGVDARDAAADVEVRARDLYVVYVERAHGADLQPLGRRAPLVQNVRERHREARAVGGCH